MFGYECVRMYGSDFFTTKNIPTDHNSWYECENKGMRDNERQRNIYDGLGEFCHEFSLYLFFLYGCEFVSAIFYLVELSHDLYESLVCAILSDMIWCMSPAMVRLVAIGEISPDLEESQLCIVLSTWIDRMVSIGFSVLYLIYSLGSISIPESEPYE